MFLLNMPKLPVDQHVPSQETWGDIVSLVLTLITESLESPHDFQATLSKGGFPLIFAFF